MGMSGEEYFETNPNDNSYEDAYENTIDNINNTNRDLLNTDSVAIDMLSPDVSAMDQNGDKE